MPLVKQNTDYEYDMTVFRRIGEGMLNPVFGGYLKSKINHENNILDKINKKIIKKPKKRIPRFRSYSI